VTGITGKLDIPAWNASAYAVAKPKVWHGLDLVGIPLQKGANAPLLFFASFPRTPVVEPQGYTNVSCQGSDGKPCTDHSAAICSSEDQR
jgi:hypothetical protein